MNALISILLQIFLPVLLEWLKAKGTEEQIAAAKTLTPVLKDEAFQGYLRRHKRAGLFRDAS